MKQRVIKRKKISEISDRAKAISEAVKNLTTGNILLVAGKGHETVQLIGDETLPFSDANVAQNAISNMKNAHDTQRLEAWDDQ